MLHELANASFETKGAETVFYAYWPTVKEFQGLGTFYSYAFPVRRIGWSGGASCVGDGRANSNVARISLPSDRSTTEALAPE
jgi:hypothetical protein